MGSGSAFAQTAWERPAMTDPDHVQMGGAWGEAYDRGVARIGQHPYTTKFLLADLNFDMKRWFTEFSGDVSGRFLELASLTSTPDAPRPATLRPVLAAGPELQKADGHFGIDVDWAGPIDFAPKPHVKSRMMPIMWGNGRMLLGLVAAYERFGDQSALAAARKLGDFYVNVAVDRFCDPARAEEYKQAAEYATAYVTCVFEGMEGLVRLYRATHDERYLTVARRMADFHELYDTLPVAHAHGSIGEHVALLLLYEETGDAKYLTRVTRRWNDVVDGGYVNPAGGVLEKFFVNFKRDEGCAEADWLHLNVELWRITGQTKYLDMAEREMWTEYLANQWPDGGYGHRMMSCDATGAYGFGRHDQEAVWCCCFHGPLGLYYLKGALAAGNSRGIFYNFPVDFSASVTAAGGQWTINSRTELDRYDVPVNCTVRLQGPAGGRTVLWIRRPEWADGVIVLQSGKPLPTTLENGYIQTPALETDATVEIRYQAHPYLEDRRLARIKIPEDLPATLDNVVIRCGPHVLVSVNHGDIETVTLPISREQAIQLPDPGGPAAMSPWRGLGNPEEPHAFVINGRLTRD
jgi:DUF1680 family protein